MSDIFEPFCLAHMLDYIVMQMRKTNPVRKGLSRNNRNEVYEYYRNIGDALEYPHNASL